MNCDLSCTIIRNSVIISVTSNDNDTDSVKENLTTFLPAFTLLDDE